MKINFSDSYECGVKDENNQEKNIRISFSSYPGCLTSTDDFYIINGNLLVMETSLEVLVKKYV